MQWLGTYLGLINTKNYDILSKVKVSVSAENHVKQGLPTHYYKPQKAKGLIRFPYGSPFQNLANDVIKPFARFLYSLKMAIVLCLFFISEKVFFEPKVTILSVFFCLRNSVHLIPHRTLQPEPPAAYGSIRCLYS